MTISLNQFAPNVPVAGQYVYIANLPQLHNVIVSASQGTALKAGAIVKLDSSATNLDAPVALQASKTDAVFGVITYNPIKNDFAAGERIAVARPNDIVWLPAAGAISAGAALGFNSSNQVTASPSSGDTIIGKALTPASAANDLVQVELGFSLAESAS